MLKNCIFRWRNEKGPYSFCFKMCSIDIKFKKNILQYWSPLSLLKNAFCCQSGFRTNGTCRLKTFGKSISPSQTKNYTSFYILHKILFSWSSTIHYSIVQYRWHLQLCPQSSLCISIIHILTSKVVITVTYQKVLHVLTILIIWQFLSAL